MCDLATLFWSQVQKEPITCEASHDDLSSGDTLVADLRVRGVWQPQVGVLFDVRIVDTDTPSYQGRTAQAVLHTAETEKRFKSFPACHDLQAGFTPLYFSVDGMLGTQVDYFMC